MKLTTLPIESQQFKPTDEQRPFLSIPCRDLDSMRRLARALSDAFGVTQLITPNICNLLYSNTLTLTGDSPASVFTVKHERLNAGLEQALPVLCNHVLKESLGFMGGLNLQGWSLEAEIDYYPHREHVLTDAPSTFGLHRDDYIPEGRRSSDGGVMFVALVYLNEQTIFGPELFVDLGPEQHSTALTVPQIRSLPPEFCRRVLAAKESELKRRARELHIYCPIVRPYGTVCFCEPLVIHQTPVPPNRVRTPARLAFRSDHGSARPEHVSANFPVNVSSTTATSCTISRELETFYDTGGLQAIFEQTFNGPRSLIRLTFRALRVD